jgi:hypothetical protein
VLAVATLCLFVGGWPWALISILAFVCIAKFDAEAILLAACVSLLWLVVFHATGDRRLFFPFSIQFALQAGFTRRLRCAIVVLPFMLIRVAQGATVKVLAVELAVAAIVAAVSLAGYGRSSGRWQARTGWAGFGSFLAFVGLAL